MSCVSVHEHLIRSDAETKTFRQGSFCKLSDCPQEFQLNFLTARKAIENDKLTEFKEAVKAMTNSGVPTEYRLDVCEMVTFDEHVYPMTLMAFAGYYGRKVMLEVLHSKGAHIDMGNECCGTPLLQMMVYAINLEGGDQLNVNIVQFFIEKGEFLSRVLTVGKCNNSSALEMSINLQRLDIAQLLIEAGVDPIYGGDPDWKPIFLEYSQFGTNEFIKWLLDYYQERNQMSTFIDRLLNGDVFSSPATQYFFSTFGRNIVHTFLLSGHEGAVNNLLNRESTAHFLGECDPFGKTALHIAAEKGHIVNVKILLEQGAPIDVEDVKSMTPLMLATVNGHEEVVKSILVKLAKHQSEGRETVVLRNSDPMGLWSWALQCKFSTYFEAMHQTEELEECLYQPLDNDENTIVHLAAEGGHVPVFKSVLHKTCEPFFEILKKENQQKKTPLQLAIDNGNIGILSALHEHRAESKKQVPKGVIWYQAQSKVEKEWKEFWNSESPGLMLYACLYGTVEIVKHFVTKLVSPTLRCGRYTPLACAAEAGNHNIVTYLLSIRGVSVEGVGIDEVNELKLESENQRPYSPLMLAAKYGNAPSVTLLLAKKADITVKSEQGYNCLMECISGGHETTATAILTHSWDDTEEQKWKDFMKCSVERDGQFITPLRMLIEKMPDVAEMVFTMCLTNNRQSVIYNFEFIEDYRKEDIPLTVQSVPNVATTLIPLEEGNNYPEWLHNQEKNGHACPQESVPSQLKGYVSCHPLTLMVEHKRLKLLQHPLINVYISHKWWKLAFPLFLYILIYVLLLILLTIFAVKLPRPGPDDDFCPSNHSGSGYVMLNLRDGTCKEPDEKGFIALAVIIILLSIIYFGFDILFEIMTWKLIARMRDRYVAVVEVIFRSVTFSLIIIFVFGFGNDCWCAPPWQWQIGAFAIFLAYINLLLLFKGIPLLGVPINMLFHIVITFLKLIYLPILLIFSFAIPFYMLFVRDGDAVLDEGGPGLLKAFTTPAHSIAKTIVQTTGELDFGIIFNDADLLYSPMAYILFIIFVVLMPILFSNLLVGLAVGTTEKDTENATFTNIKLRVGYIVGLETFCILRRWGKLPSLEFNEESLFSKLRGVDYETQEKLVGDTIHRDNSKEEIQTLKEKTIKMSVTLQENMGRRLCQNQSKRQI